MPDESPLTEILGRIIYEAANLESSLSLLLEDIVASDHGWVLINGAGANTVIEWLATIAKSERSRHSHLLERLSSRARDLNNVRNQVVHATWAYSSPRYFEGETDESPGGRWVAIRERQRKFLLQSQEFTIAELRQLIVQLRELRSEVDALHLVCARERFGEDYPAPPTLDDGMHPEG